MYTKGQYETDIARVKQFDAPDANIIILVMGSCTRDVNPEIGVYLGGEFAIATFPKDESLSHIGIMIPATAFPGSGPKPDSVWRLKMWLQAAFWSPNPIFELTYLGDSSDLRINIDMHNYLSRMVQAPLIIYTPETSGSLAIKSGEGVGSKLSSIGGVVSATDGDRLNNASCRVLNDMYVRINAVIAKHGVTKILCRRMVTSEPRHDGKNEIYLDCVFERADGTRFYVDAGTDNDEIREQ